MVTRVPPYVYFTTLCIIALCPGHICQESYVCYKNTDLLLHPVEGQAELFKLTYLVSVTQSR